MFHGMMQKLRDWAQTLKRDTLALYLAARDPRTPFTAKLLAGLCAAYALSPIDLIPDFIPVIGYLDDLLILPLGIWLVLKIIPKELMQEFRTQAETMQSKPESRTAMVVIILIWGALALWLAAALFMAA